MKSAKGQHVGYVRVSSVDQATDRQLEGLGLDRVFTDKASGKDTDRPALKDALAYVRAGDTLVIHSMDRLARNAEDLLRTVRELAGRGVTVQFVKEAMTFSGDDAPMAKLMLTMLAGFAEFERSLIRERQREGIAIAKTKGVYKGRKPSLSVQQVADIERRIAAGETVTKLAAEYGVSRETIYSHRRVSNAA